jgi:hypothetical protein
MVFSPQAKWFEENDSDVPQMQCRSVAEKATNVPKPTKSAYLDYDRSETVFRSQVGHG